MEAQARATNGREKEYIGEASDDITAQNDDGDAIAGDDGGFGFDLRRPLALDMMLSISAASLMKRIVTRHNMSRTLCE